MSNNGNAQQQPGMASFSYGVAPNQMMQQQFLPPVQGNQLAGMHFNGVPPAPQLMPNLPIFFNPFQPMGGMPQQMFNPMQLAPAPMGGQMPQLPPTAGPNPQFAPMAGGPMPMFPPMGYQMPMMGLMGGHPFMPQYMYAMPMQLPLLFPPNATMPAPIPIKAEVKEEPPSVFEVTPPEIVRRNFTIAHLLKPVEVKEEPKEPVDQEATPNTSADSSNAANPAETSDSLPDEDDLFGPSSPIVPTTPSLVPAEVPDTPASPDHQDTVDHESQIVPEKTVLVDQVDAPVVPSSGVSHLEHVVGGDEYLSGDETVDKSAEGEPLAHSNTHSFGQKTPDTSRTPERLTIVEESDESISPAGVSVLPLKESCQMERLIEGQELDETSKDSEEARIDEIVKESVEMKKPPETSESRESLTAHRIFRQRSQSPPPSVPPRFPRRRRNSSEDEGRVSTSREEISPWRKSPVRWRGRDEMEISPPRRRLNGRVNPHTVLLRGVPPRLDGKRMERLIEERYGRCRLIRVNGEPGTVKIEFVSTMDRDQLMRHNSITISRERLSVHGEMMSERHESTSDMSVEVKSEKSVVELKSEKASESKEETGPPRVVPLPTPPVRTLSAADLEAIKRVDANLQLEKCTVRTQGKFRKDILLTAGPIPKECSATSVVTYFRGLLCHVLGVPFPSHRPHEYIILRFNEIGHAKRILAAQEHRVMGHLIPVYPPFDVHLQLNGMRGLEEEVMNQLQDSCGVLISLPSLPYLSDRFIQKHQYGYVTFGRPQDGLKAIKDKYFFAFGKPFTVVTSDHNYSFMQFEDVWEAKSKLETLTSKMAEARNSARIIEEAKKNAKKKNTLKKTIITDERPILTVGPIPEHCQKECDDYLLSNFDDVYAIPFAMNDGRHFRLISVREPAKISELLKEGYLKVGEKDERILVSPSFDVAFKRSSKIHIDSSQLVTSMQRKYGPIVRHPNQKHGHIKVAFGRIQDGLRAVEDSPHFKTLNVMAEASEPNQSFSHFVLAVDLQVLLDRAREADKMEEAANIHGSSRTNSDDSIRSTTSSGKRRRITEEPPIIDDDVMVCSPPAPKKTKPEMKAKQPEEKPEMGVTVRVSDPEQWIPDKTALVAHFGQFGKLAKFEYKDHLEAYVLFEEPGQAGKALKLPKVRIGGRWLDVLPLSQSTPSTSQ